MKKRAVRRLFFIGGIFFVALVGLGVVGFSSALAPIEYQGSNVGIINNEDVFVPTHLPTPPSVKAVYMTSWTAGSEKQRSRLIDLVAETELNSVVIDIKDYSGKLAFPIDDPYVLAQDAAENRIPDIAEFVDRLHREGIYVIGRITVFQDPHLVARRPDLAVRRAGDGGVWADYKGISWLDPGAQEVWDYIVAIGRGSHALGFDELNFDYIRFPSDGNMYDIHYPFSEERVSADPNLGKAYIMKDFFTHLSDNLSPTGAVLSADLFGMTTTNPDDLNIGQLLTFAAPFFDYLAPMVYPSHYPPQFNGYANPAVMPYEVVKFSLDKGSEKLLAASSTPGKLRPWLQDFDLGADYTPDMVRAQISATYDAGISSWMLWDPRNIYTREALLLQ